MIKQNRFQTLDEALDSEGLLETWDLSVREILHGRTFSYTYEDGSKYGYYVSVHRFEDGSYERPVHYKR
jgi:hypothetical protein